MIKHLILIRHGKSSWAPYSRKNFVGDDHQRPLNHRGKMAAKDLSVHLGLTIGSIDKIFSSSAVRATKTLKIIEENVKTNHKSEIEPRLYTFEEEKLLEYIKETDNRLQNIAIIGHNPAIQKLCTLLIERNSFGGFYEKLSEKFPTCGTALIKLRARTWREVTQNCGYLESFITPKSISD